ncbi:MAG TPA: ABC transporter substrate-binding protein [Beijerinckiaceae bacterium]|nr:ABC transporter substrate-binding protein [Beijerinckiaceae bacterium]
MRASVFSLACVALLTASAASAAQSTVKIGLVIAYSGQFADAGAQMDDGIKLFVQRHGDTVAGKKLVFLRKDTGGIAPAVAKRLAQELVVRDKADILAGFLLTPNALAAADVSAQAKKFMVVMNAATSIIITKSPYMTRSSTTTPMLNQTFGAWAAKHGIKTAYTMVTGYGPGIDAEQAFIKGFTSAGGKIVGSVRTPVANPDFSAFIQRAKDAHPDAIYIWVPGGTQPAAVGKAIAERDIDKKKIKILGQDVLTSDSALKSMGDNALGIVTVSNYDYNHQSAKNKAFVAAYRKAFHRNPDIYSIGGYDGMRIIYNALKKTGGKTDGPALIAAAKGMSFESPRGPVSINPKTRDIIENVYIRRVEKVGSKLKNVEFDTIKHVNDPFAGKATK